MPVDTRPAPQSDDVAARSATATAHKKKQILVVVLLFGLLIAIATQPNKQTAVAEPILEASWSRPIELSREVTTRQVDSPESAKFHDNPLDKVCDLSRIPWEEITETELLAPEPVPARQTQVNPAQRVQAIYGTSTDRAALIGEAIVRGGQPLPDGGKVMDVTADGIQVAR